MDAMLSRRKTITSLKRKLESISFWEWMYGIENQLDQVMAFFNFIGIFYDFNFVFRVWKFFRVVVRVFKGTNCKVFKKLLDADVDLERGFDGG